MAQLPARFMAKGSASFADGFVRHWGGSALASVAAAVVAKLWTCAMASSGQLLYVPSWHSPPISGETGPQIREPDLSSSRICSLNCGLLCGHHERIVQNKRPHNLESSPFLLL